MTLDEFDLIAPVLFTQDPLFVGELTRFSAQVGPRAAQLTRQLAIEKLQSIQRVGSPAGQLGAPGQIDERIVGVQKNMQSCDGYLTARNYPAACLYARRALRALGAIERQRWQAAVEGLGSPVASPGAVSLDTLPWHRSLVQRIAASRPGPNRLAGGDFETIDAMLAAGWRYYQNAPSGVQTGADLVSDAAHSGRAGVLLSVRAEDAKNPPAVFETPPAWLTSPPVAVEAGQLLRISGWVNVAAAITGSVDGLMVVDSLTGQTLAQRVDRTVGWQPFTLYRAAPQSSQVTVTFVLSGLGEARIDDVTIETLDPMSNGEMTQRPAVPTGRLGW